MKLKDLILEGMYDKLTGDINKAIFKKVKDAIKGSGTQEKPKKYKGYEVRKDPMPTLSMQNLFQSETRTIYVGEFSDNVSGVDVEVDLKFAISEDGVKKGAFFIDGSAEADEDYPSIEVNIAIHPEDGEKRHEIEHLTHGRGSAALKPSKVMRGDKAMRAKIRGNEKNYYKYFLLPKEVDANIHGLYSKAKTMKKPYQDVVDDYLDSLVDDGIITSKNRQLIYKTWKNRIPKIGGLPTLK